MDRTKLAVVIAVLLVAPSGIAAATSDDGAVDRRDDRNIQTPADGISTLVDSASALQQRIDEAASFDAATSVPDLLPPALAPVLGYSRHDDSDPLAHETRRAIYEVVGDAPGTYAAAVADEVGEPDSTVRYHLRVLEGESLVQSEVIRGRRRVFRSDVEDPRLAAATADGPTASVLDAVGREGPTSVSTLSDVLDRAPSTVSYHVSRLSEAGLVTRERDGRQVLVSLTPSASSEVVDLPRDDD